jgi:hypothetical protein
LLIVVARFCFSCSLFATFGAQNSEEINIWRKLIMKIAMRMVVLTLLLVAAAFSQMSFEGPGTIPNDPPVAAV